MSEPRNTRERIRQIAMELFSEQGYDRTSLREIAEKLGLTKAALYYHFKTKEDIADSYFDDLQAEVEELATWAAEQPRTIVTRREVLRRYSAVLGRHGPTLRFMHHNQPAMKQSSRGDQFKAAMVRLQKSVTPDDPTRIQRLRAIDAIMTMHLAWFLPLEDVEPDDLRQPALDIALELVEANENR